LATTFAYTLVIYVLATTGSPAWPRVEGALGPLVDLVAAWVPAVDRVASRVLELGYPARAELVRHLYGVSWAMAAFWALLSLPAHLAFRPRQVLAEEQKRSEAEAWANAIASDREQPAWRRKAWTARGVAGPKARDIGMILLVVGAASFGYGGFGDVILQQEGKADLELLFMPQAMDSALFTPALLAPLAFACTMAGLGFLRRPRSAPPTATSPCSAIVDRDPGSDAAASG
jgi:hypothetical protein